jgi:hypothetical protein
MTDYRCHRAEHCADAQRTEVELCGGNCECHTGPYAPCSIPGGCGHTHTMAGVRVGADIEFARGLCDTCTRIVSHGIRMLPYDYASLRVACQGDMSGNWSEVVTASRELPVPISLTFDTLAAQILAETITFVEPVAEALAIDWDALVTPRHRSRYGPPPRYQSAVIFSKAAALLANATATLIALPLWPYRLWADGEQVEVEADGVTVALGLATLHRAARGALGLIRQRGHLVTPCPRCSTQALVREAGRDGVYCAGCQARYSDTDYRQLTQILAVEHGRTG